MTAQFTYSYKNYGLELEGAEGRFYADGQLIFKGFSSIALEQYLRHAPEEKKRFKAQLAAINHSHHLSNLHRSLPGEDPSAN